VANPFDFNARGQRGNAAASVPYSRFGNFFTTALPRRGQHLETISEIQLDFSRPRGTGSGRSKLETGNILGIVVERKLSVIENIEHVYAEVETVTVLQYNLLEQAKVEIVDSRPGKHVSTEVSEPSLINALR
jgi:hypothetical protein